MADGELRPKEPRIGERRTNLRLRKLIDDLQAADRENQDAIDTLASHVSLLAHELEALKRSKD